MRTCSLVVLLLASLGVQAADVSPDLYHVGIARVEITPQHPIRLNGFGFRRAESEGVQHPIHARALAIRHAEDAEPVVFLMADVLGIPPKVRSELAQRLEKSAKLRSERFAILATHTHCGPMLAGANPTIFGVPIPEDHLANIEKYTPVFVERMEEAVLKAVRSSQPAHVYWGVGSVGFAMNRRARNGGPGGPIDHDLPTLVVRDAKTNAVRAVHAGYACHAVTLSHNKLGGDWPGFAAEAIESAFPDSVALVTIGCGADQNPNSGVTGDKVEVAQAQGRELAAEVKRLVSQPLTPLQGRITAKMQSLTLPLAKLPTLEEWEQKARRMDAIGHHARVQLARLDRKESLATEVEYPIQTWTFGDSLACVHLAGEVVVDYSQRLKKELDRQRVWIASYANHNPCYIPSERILKEGGYEGGGAMIYYDLPVPFQPGLEVKIIQEVHRQLGKRFDARFDSNKSSGTQPMSPLQSLASLRTLPNLEVALVAAEPLVTDPVAMSFGPDGKLWVAEMCDYPSGVKGDYAPGGRIRMLEDRNGDGQFDSATTFLDGLPFPTGLLVWRKGVLVCAAPDILYAEDTSGDGKADRVTKLYSGFGTENFQARVNSLTYGLDGHVYGSCGLFGGDILCHKTGKTVALGDRDFRIDPDAGTIEPATGRTQQGRTRDDWGNWFGCDNSNICWHHALADEYLSRNPHVVPPRPTTFVPTGDDPQKLFPIRETQLFVLSGPPGRPTGACGVGIYRDQLLGSDFQGNAFTCEPVCHLVTRRVLSPSGSTFRGQRAPGESDREFLVSLDPWSRPVQAITGPDGALWVADMYRLVIEHPRWIPTEDLARLDVRAGAGMGRIYQVRPKGKLPAAWPKLSALSSEELVKSLDSANGWQRDMASELLVWGDHRSVIPQLEQLSQKGSRAEARLHGLSVLHRLKSLSVSTIQTALKDAHPGVRRWAVRFAEPHLSTHDDLRTAVLTLQGDADAQVRLQVACSLGALPTAESGATLAKLAQSQTRDSLMTAAVISSLNPGNFATFAEAMLSRKPAKGPPPLLSALVATSVGMEDPERLANLLTIVTEPVQGHYESWQFAAADAVLTALERNPSRARPESISRLVQAARECVVDEKRDASLRATATRLLGRDPAKLSDDLTRLTRCLGPQSSPVVVGAAISALGRIRDDRAADALLSSWSGLAPGSAAQAIGVLLSRDAWTHKLLAAVAAGQVSPGAFHPGNRQGLVTHPNLELRAAAEKAFGKHQADRQALIASYSAAVHLKGDTQQGKAIFLKVCSNCHRLEGQGNAVGPDLAALQNKTPAYFLTEILDPNRNLDNRYISYVVNTVDGRTLNGLLASETSSSIVLVSTEGKEIPLLRSDIESMRSSARSLMPEGLEKDVPPPAMSDLLAYLVSATASSAQPEKPSVAEAALRILDDKRPREEREALIAQFPDKGAELILAMAADCQPGTPEEYRRIPWIWRVAIAAGKRNDLKQMKPILDVAIPKPGQPLLDWQAVVIGGGIINGISMEHGWPEPRLNEMLGNDLALRARWQETLKASVRMADNEKVPTGTRYDAIRFLPFLGWKASKPQLLKYLAKGTHAELQMGAVSALVDVEEPEATQALIGALDYLTGRNRELALQGLARSPDRANALLDQVAEGKLKVNSIPESARKLYLESNFPEVKRRAARLLRD